MFWGHATLQSDLITLASTVSGHTTNISALQSAVSTLQGDVSTLQSNVSALQSTVSGLESDVDTLQSDVTTLQGQVSTLQGDVTTLQSQVSTLQSEVADLQSRMTAVESDIEDLQSDIGNMTDALDLHNPFYPGLQISVITDATMHRTRGYGLIILEDKWLVIFGEASAHDIGDRIVRVGETQGGGKLVNMRTIYSEEDVDVSPTVVWMMDDGRIGVIAARTIGDYADYPVFIYSDDDGDNWSSEILDTNHDASMVKGNLGRCATRYPTSVGGDDDGGWLALIHQSRLDPGEADKTVHALYTTDNGENWEATEILDADDFTDYVIPDEPYFTRFGTEDKWIVLFRETDATNSPLVNTPLFKSTDLFNWTGPLDTGQWNGRNGAYIVYDDGFITWISPSRPYHYEDDDSRGIPVNGEVFQGLVTQTVNADELWNDATAWPGWSELARLPHLLGNPKLIQCGDKWFGLVGVNEGPWGIGATSTKTYSQIAIMTAVSYGPKTSDVPSGENAENIYFWSFEAIAGMAVNVDDAATSPFSGLINAGGSGELTATNVPYDGESNENCLKTLKTGADKWGRFILHNTTRGNSRLVISWDVNTNTITTETTSDNWADNDNITLQSQTCTQAGFMDLDLSNEIDSDVRVAFIMIEAVDKSGGDQSGRRIQVHPYESYDVARRLAANLYLADEKTGISGFMVINDQKICIQHSGATDVGYSICVLATLR